MTYKRREYLSQGVRLEARLVQLCLQVETGLFVGRSLQEGVEESQPRRLEIGGSRTAQHPCKEPEAHRLRKAQPQRGQSLRNGAVAAARRLARPRQQLHNVNSLTSLLILLTLNC